MEKNVWRDISYKIKPIIITYFGKYYSWFHILFLGINILFILFVNDINILILALIGLTIESYINLSNDDYPLTMLEKNEVWKKDNADKNYYINTSNEINTNIWAFVALKILCIICSMMFKENFHI